MRNSILKFMLMAILLVAASPSAVDAQDVEGKSPASLLIYPGSENVRYKQQSGAWWAYYDAKLQYPAEDLLGFIHQGLESQGWLPLREDILNPGLPSSHVTGWQAFVDGRTSPKTKVHQWLAQWKNSQGDVVWYALRYRASEGASAIPEYVSVVATYYPASIVEQGLKWAEGERTKK